MIPAFFMVICFYKFSLWQFKGTGAWDWMLRDIKNVLEIYSPLDYISPRSGQYPVEPAEPRAGQKTSSGKMLICLAFIKQFICCAPTNNLSCLSRERNYSPKTISLNDVQGYSEPAAIN